MAFRGLAADVEVEVHTGFVLDDVAPDGDAPVFEFGADAHKVPLKGAVEILIAAESVTREEGAVEGEVNGGFDAGVEFVAGNAAHAALKDAVLHGAAPAEEGHGLVADAVEERHAVEVERTAVEGGAAERGGFHGVQQLGGGGQTQQQQTGPAGKRGRFHEHRPSRKVSRGRQKMHSKIAPEHILWKDVQMSSLFTRIIRGEIPCAKLYEDDAFFAFLDIRPIRTGHALLIPKLEVDYLFDAPDAVLSRMLVVARPIAKAIEAEVPCERTGLMVAGLEVPHCHLHLVPMSGIGDLNFAHASPADPAELQALAARIRQHLT